jgi:hypothetical protein
MESTYYNVVAPASYEGLSKFKPKSYTKKQVREWLQSQDTYTLHKPTRRRFTRRRVVVYGIDHQWHSLVLSRFQTVEIYIRDDTGVKIPFERGRVVMTLHCRKRKESYLE